MVPGFLGAVGIAINANNKATNKNAVNTTVFVKMMLGFVIAPPVRQHWRFLQSTACAKDLTFRRPIVVGWRMGKFSLRGNYVVAHWLS
jgi:hypothetical protein